MNNFKRLLSVILSALILTSVFAIIPVTASAATSGDYEYTVLDDGTAEITGYTGSATSLTIPSTLDGYTVTSIGDDAFYWCESIASVTIPDTVTNIGDYVFNGTACYKDENNWVDGILYIDNCLIVADNSAISAKTTIKDGTRLIAKNAFSGCTALEGVTVPSSVTSIGYRSFASCTSLSNIVINNGVTEIGGYAFSGCTALESITIPGSITTVGEVPFWNCYNLSSVIFSYGITRIEDEMFFDCTGLTSVTIPNSVTTIGEMSFCDTALTSVEIPNSVTTIEYMAFYNCTSLTSATIPASVTSIGSGAFSCCDKLTIYGYTGSYAETYAKEENIPFTALTSTTKISVSATSKTLYVKGTYSINPSIENASGTTAYTSSNSSVATVSSSGKVTAKKKGTTTITIINNGATAEVKITVKNPKLNKSNVTVKKGKSFKLKVTGLVGKASFKSSKAKVAKVNASGKVTAKKKGSATITVTANGIKLKCKVKVK